MKRPKKLSPEEFKKVTRPIVISEGIIRPTGLLDPIIILKPVQNQVDDVLSEVKKRVLKKQRVLITTLTKKFAQELDLYFKQISVKSAYIHSDVNTIERLEILSDLRSGKYDVLIGINLLREGLDLPEVSLVAIFDADKEGFLRSRTSLIQIVGRAARHSEGTVIMYADNMTGSMKEAIEETNRRRELQTLYNKKHGITPKSTVRGDESIAHDVKEETKKLQNEKKESDAKSRLTHSPFGFVEVDKKPKEMELEIDSRYSNSVHGSKRRAKSMRKAEQLYASFDQVKNEMIVKLEGLSKKELKDKLEIAIDALNFEEAAAIRDILKDK